MMFVEQMLHHTPPAVFVLLAFLIWRGVQGLRPRTLSLWRLCIVPVIFIVIGVSMLFMHHAGSVWPPLAWLGMLTLLTPVRLLTGPKLLAVDRGRGVVTTGGSVLPIVRNVLVFVLQHGVAVTAALHPGQRDLLAVVTRVVSGATAGYFLGWSIAMILHYRRAPALPVPDPDPAGRAPASEGAQPT